MVRPLDELVNVSDRDVEEVVRSLRRKAQEDRQRAAVHDTLADELEDKLNGNS